MLIFFSFSFSFSMQRQSDHPRFRVRTHTHSKGIKLTSQIPLAYTFFLLPLSLVPTICPPTGLALGCIFRHVILFVLPFFQKVSLITSVFSFLFLSLSTSKQWKKKKLTLWWADFALRLKENPKYSKSTWGSNLKVCSGRCTCRHLVHLSLVDTAWPLN